MITHSQRLREIADWIEDIVKDDVPQYRRQGDDYAEAICAAADWVDRVPHAEDCAGWTWLRETDGENQLRAMNVVHCDCHHSEAAP